MQGQFVFPRINSIEVKNYTLFKESWKCNFNDGSNLILGVNSIGKTTTLRLICYALLGKYEEKVRIMGNTRAVDKRNVNYQYFLNRSIPGNKKNYEKNATPSVTLSFNLDEVEVNIERSLANEEILSLTVDNESIKTEDEVYKEVLREHGNIIDSFMEGNDNSHFQSLILKLLIREEEDHYLLWDGMAQAEIFNLILFDADFNYRYDKSLQEYHNLSNKLKGIYHEKSQINTRIKEIESNSKKKPEAPSINIEQLEKELHDLTTNISNLENQRMQLVEKRNAESTEISIYSRKAQKLEGDFDIIGERLEKFELKFLKNSFGSDSLNLLIRKLEDYNICSLCNTKLANKKYEKALENINHNECPVCESALNEEESEKLSAPEINEIDELKKKKESNLKELDHYKEKLNSIQSSASNYTSKILKIDEDIWKLRIEIRSKEDLITELSHEKSQRDIDQDYLRIKNLEKEKLSLQPEIEEVERDQKKAKNEFEEILKLANQKIKDHADELNRLFVKNCKEFFGDKVALKSINTRMSASSQITSLFGSFRPDIQGMEKSDPSSVSTSERNILEFAFRSAVIEFYYSQSGYKPTLFLEINEGAFDSERTDALAKTLYNLGKNLEYPLILIQNLSKIDYLKELISENERKDKTFLLLKHADLSGRNKIIINRDLSSLGFDSIK